MDRGPQNPEDLMMTKYFSWSIPFRSCNTGTKPSPCHSRRQRPPALQLFPLHLLMFFLTGGVFSRSGQLSEVNHDPDAPDHSDQDSVSHLLRSVARYVWIWVCKWGPHKFLGILSMWGSVTSGKINWTQVSWVLCPRSWVEFNYHESLYSNSTHHKNSLYSTQVFRYSL